MSVPVKNGNKWRHRIMVKGERVSGTFDTKAAALKWEMQQRVILSTDRPVAVDKTCAEAFRRYELQVSRSKRGYRWKPAASRRWRHHPWDRSRCARSPLLTSPPGAMTACAVSRVAP